MNTQARINWGRWIADCPRPHCTSAEDLTARQTLFHCSYCHQVAEVQWPTDPDGLWAALERRPVQSTRNWYPAGHNEAVQLGLPHGQTVADLEVETREYEVA